MNRSVNDPSSCVCFNLRKATRAVTAEYDDRLRDEGITTPQFTILSVLQAIQPSAMTELADGLVMDRTTLSRNLDRLENQGLVMSRPGKKDARTRVLELTEEGQTMLDTAFPTWEKAQRDLVAELGKEQFETLMDLLEEVTQAVGD